ncbi:GerAB/ArcD/ProY family transporter [Bacillus sp. V5-8f]|uniref:GerAB/ArcD/ProY family transporter n=1 Tax=Bacillus sp. V5-8f TaxID=2053044 RepID=UPI000C761D16|nr:GerAB/ArcD/ProY family transporter [Bacillus sp. V5-8f]PLT32902.1 hypothetical protein CUU64_15795 [Bacillus sp. V5-8f]
MKEKLHSFHLVILVYLTQTGVVLFALPHTLAVHFGTNGWLALFLVSALAYLNIFLIGAAYRRAKGQCILDLIEERFQRVAAYLLFGFLAVVWSVIACLIAKQYVTLYQLLSYHSTPTLALKLAFDLLVYMLVIKGIYIIAKTSTFIFSISVILSVLFMYFFREIELARFTSFVFKEGDGWTRGIFQTYLTFIGYELSILFFPFTNRESKFFKSLMLGQLVTTIIYAYTSIICFGFFGHQYLKKILFPLLDALSYIQFPFVERLENFLYGLFLLKTLISVTVFYWASIQAANRIFKTINRNFLSALIIAGTLAISAFAYSMEEVENWLTNLSIVEMGIGFLLPAITILLTRQRQERRQVDG